MAQQREDLPPAPELDPTPDDVWLEGLIDWAVTEAENPSVLTAENRPDDPAQLLTEVLAGHLAVADYPDKAARWTVTDDGSAEWAMGHAARAEDALAQLAQQAQVWRDEAAERLVRIDAWFAHAAKRHRAKLAFMAAHLQAYALDRREADPKHNKTLVLPSGVVKTTEHQPKVAVADEAQVVAWVVSQFAVHPQIVDEVAPAQPRKLYVQKLRDRTTVVEVIDHAQLLLASAELVHWVRYQVAVGDPDTYPRGAGHASDGSTYHVGAEHERCPQPGDGWPSPDEATDLVARVEVLASHLEVHGPDGRQVPGTDVEPGGVTAKVVPAP